jgi:hypothetical protein
VLADREFWVYAALGSLADNGALVHKCARSGQDGGVLDLGDLQIRKGHFLAGRVVLTDGRRLPVGPTVWAQNSVAAGELPSKLDEQGHFEIDGLPEGTVFVSITLPSEPAVAAYRLSPKNKCLDPRRRLHLVGQITRDIGDLTILLEPGPAPDSDIPDQALDPAAVADFDDAHAGPITGVAPGDYPPS